jgi:alpha-1,3-mannosyltransferase
VTSPNLGNSDAWIRLIIVGSIEYAWNVYPSTTLSSAVLGVAHVVLVAGVWFGYAEGRAVIRRSDKPRSSPVRIL